LGVNEKTGNVLRRLRVLCDRGFLSLLHYRNKQGNVLFSLATSTDLPSVDSLRKKTLNDKKLNDIKYRRGCRRKVKEDWYTTLTTMQKAVFDTIKAGYYTSDVLITHNFLKEELGVKHNSLMNILTALMKRGAITKHECNHPDMEIKVYYYRPHPKTLYDQTILRTAEAIRSRNYSQGLTHQTYSDIL
jgi:hypothetical protein